MSVLAVPAIQLQALAAPGAPPDPGETWWEWTKELVGGLDIDNLPSVIFFPLLTLAVFVWCWFRRKKGKRWYFFPLPLAIIPFLIGALAAVNLHFGLYNTLGDLWATYPFPTGAASLLSDPNGSHPDGVSVQIDIPSPGSKVGSQPAFIWLPPQYFTEPKGTKFPVIYLYHGTPGDYTQWFLGGNAQQVGLTAAKAGSPAILVSPQVIATEFEDTECVNGAQGNWQDYIAIDIPAFIAKNASALSGATAQSAAGLSMGGYCAQIVALRNPALMGIFGNFSGSTMPTYSSMQDLFGPVPDLQATVNTYTSDWVIANQPASHTVKSWLMIGAQDDPGLISDEQSYTAQAKGLNMNATFNAIPGTHSFYVWSAALAEWLPWALSQMSKPGATTVAPPANASSPPASPTPAPGQ